MMAREYVEALIVDSIYSLFKTLVLRPRLSGNKDERTGRKGNRHIGTGRGRVRPASPARAHHGIGLSSINTSFQLDS